MLIRFVRDKCLSMCVHEKQYMYEQEFRGRRHMPPKQGLDFHTYCDSDLHL